MSIKEDGNQNSQGPKVLKLGLNISVSGDPGTDFEIVLDENGQKSIQALDPLELDQSASSVPVEEKSIQENASVHSTGAISKQTKTKSISLSDSSRESEEEKTECKDLSIIDKIKTTMEHFEKFSDHIKEIPRLKNIPVATSTPFSDKLNSKSETSLVYPEYKPRKYGHLYDFHSKREYYRSSIRPFPSDLFLKPLPGENFYKRGIYTKYFDVEPYHHYGSDTILNKSSEYKIGSPKQKWDIDKHDAYNLPVVQPSGILKKSDNESGDKHSTSSAESVKDIKIYQSGGILIMQNFKDNLDAAEKKEMSDFSAKLIENCNKLKEEIGNFQMQKPFSENSTDENKNSGKTVQFDLTCLEEKSKSSDLCAARDETSFAKMESSESTSDCPKIKDTSPQGTCQSQDFPSLSTQENDSIVSNQPGTSPTFVSPKKLEWDSGADIGYMNLDLTRENLSTIERIVLKGISSDGMSEKNVVYEKKPEKNQSNRSKFILERIPSDLVDEEIVNNLKKRENVCTFDGDKTEKKRDAVFLRESEEKKFKKISEEKIEMTNVYGNSSKVTPKGKSLFKLADSKPVRKGSATKKAEKIKLKEKSLCTTDKSVNVNTLWEDTSCEVSLRHSTETDSLKQTEHFSKVKSRRYSPKVKKLKKKKSSVLKSVSTKEKKDCLTGRLSKNSCIEMGLPKKNNKNLEAIQVLNDVELSREVEEIVIDQRYQSKPHAINEKKISEEPSNTPVEDKAENKTEGKVKSRPISASSGSNKTVLPKASIEKSNAIAEKKFTNQIIQTSDLDCESVGVQAFASQVSSDFDFKEHRTRDAARENVNTSSKNIQAFGLNASLPKQLEHPKESSESIPNQNNTKSTQFFGGPVNSLPNYHSNLVTKPAESCGRPKILKAKKNLEAELIRMKEENEKNILANEPSKISSTKTESKKRSSIENKENLMRKTSSNSKKSQSSASRKTSKENDSTSQDSDKKKKEQSSGKAKKAQSAEGSECLHTSDDVSSLVLTSEVLKVHGDSIDRNIIQEKYFQSQLVEFQMRNMITRSTSMEVQEGDEKDSCKKYSSIGCQYSPQSKEATSEERSKHQENSSSKGDFDTQKNQKKKRLHCRQSFAENGKGHEEGTPEQYDSSQNAAEDGFDTLRSTNRERGLGNGDSLPSSTQTAHSWVPGVQNTGENLSGVGRARSFEYLPGHIYESSGNLREELPSETERNIITSSSSDSETAKRSLSDRARESEGRNTLVLENSTESSQDTDRLKILDGNLTQLDLALLKLREKDAQVQSLTRTLLARLWKKNGSGDFVTLGTSPSGGADMSKSEEMNSTRELSKNGKERGDTSSDVSQEQTKKENEGGKEISIACQTEEKSLSSDPEKFYEERKALEKRISEEKKCQIKWIENEIYHLNILRGLLEKQNYAKQRKKKHSPVLLTSNETSKSDDNYVENISKGPQSVTPVYGCTISISENAPSEGQQSNLHSRRKEQSSSQWAQYSQEEPPQYGMALSLSGKDKSKSWRRVVMLPVGVQVSLKDGNILQEGVLNEMGKEDNSPSPHRHSPEGHTPDNPIKQNNPYRCNSVSQSPVDVNTQYPSARRNFPSISVQTSLSPVERCIHCNEENCVCINLEKSSSSLSRSSRSKTSERRGSSKLTSLSEEPELENENENKISDSMDNFNATPNRESFGNNSKPKSSHGPNCKCQSVVESKSDFPCNYDKCKSIQNPDCRCQNCFIQVSSSISKQDFSCGGACHSNIYLTTDKSSSDFGTCRCSKIQLQKSSNSSCHIIKIHGAKCCLPGKDSCCCKSRTAFKRMENQACQTDLINFGPEETKNQARTNESQNYDFNEYYERREQSGTKPERRVPETNIPEQEWRSSCGCSRKTEREKGKADDHPQHYFLKIEETEVNDDSKESVEQKKSLEVITVTVPVKKAGKAKIYGSKIHETHEKHRSTAPSQVVDFPSNGCNCCSECIAHRLKPAQERESRVSNDYRRSVAEKPESPRRDLTACAKPNDQYSYETANSYGLVTCTSKELSQEYTPEEYYQDRNSRNSTEFIKESYYSQRRANESHTSQFCEDCDCSRRNYLSGNIPEIQSEYDSHKKSRGGNVKEFYRDEGSEFYESRRNPEKQQRTSQSDNAGRSSQGWSSESRNSCQQGFCRETVKHNNDYYNYNKREYMTKSELLKEEEQNRKVHNPSLKECLTTKRPDFYNSAERRRQIITERAKERVRKHKNRMECLMNLIQRCNEQEQASSKGPKRIFTTLQMREQTMKRYKKLPEVTGKLADRRKKEEYRTNKIMADIFAKKLQNEALKGKCWTCDHGNL